MWFLDRNPKFDLNLSDETNFVFFFPETILIGTNFTFSCKEGSEEHLFSVVWYHQPQQCVDLKDIVKDHNVQYIYLALLCHNSLLVVQASFRGFYQPVQFLGPKSPSKTGGTSSHLQQPYKYKLHNWTGRISGIFLRKMPNSYQKCISVTL